MFRRCCGGKRNAKKSAAAQAAAAAAANDGAKNVNDAAATPQHEKRPESAMRDNDFRNIDNNSVLVEFQENVRVSQSTETIPVAVACADDDGVAVAEKLENASANACNGRTSTNSLTTTLSTIGVDAVQQLSASPSSTASNTSSTPNSDNSQQRLPHIVRLIPKAQPDNSTTRPSTQTTDNDTTSDENTIISCDIGDSTEQLRSCLSRRTSCAATSAAANGHHHRKQVEYNERAVVIDGDGRLSDEAIALKMIEDLVDMHSAAVAAAAASAAATATDDDEVFSDSIEPQLPRGDMCTPYPKKRSSIPGLMYLPDWFGEDNSTRETDGCFEPPVTPVGRDDLELRRHRFFNDLLKAAQATREHRVRFNPLGPEIAVLGDDCNPEQSASTTQLNHLVNRLERIVERLERTVSARELEAVNATLNAVLQETIAPPASHDDTTDVAQLDSLPPPSPPPTPQSAVPAAEAVESLPSPPPPLPRSPVPLLYNGDSVDLDILPTVINNDPVVVATQTEATARTPSPPPPPPTPPTPPPPVAEAAPIISHTDDSSIAMSVLGYQDIVDGPLAQYLALSQKIGGDVATHAQSVQRAFAAQLAYVTLAAASAKPADARQQQLLKPTSDQIAAIQEFREKNRVSPFFNHLSAISESIPALGWVCVAPTPGPHVKEMNDAGQFYTNRVLKDWKDKDATHVEWARSWCQTLTELQKFVRQHHTTGLVWSGKSDTTGAAAAGGAPPPPPPGGMPPPPPVLPPIGDLSVGGAANDHSALFSQINQGADITKSLKKVTDDMKTNKNPSLRAGPAPFKAPAAASVAAPVAKKAPVVEKPPVFKQDGKKWIVEYQKSNPSLLVENAEMNNVVYLFKCENSTLTVKGKINGIIVDSCKKCSILFDNLVSSVEFVNCQSVQMQVLGTVPTISIDKTDGCQMYLSDKSLDVEIISSKSSEMNVLIPKGNGDYIEKPVPEQFKTKINGESLSTICVESLG